MKYADLSDIAKSMIHTEYLNSSGLKCPLCKHTQLEGGSVNITAGTAKQEITCLKCRAEWTDVYKLAQIVDVKERS